MPNPSEESTDFEPANQSHHLSCQQSSSGEAYSSSLNSKTLRAPRTHKPRTRRKLSSDTSIPSRKWNSYQKPMLIATPGHC
ncbi:Nonribosomal peptide synthase sidE [Fusarium oxysporum f. sp. albedinis]|nr:Nonribosomal peptide synthase sidE [Fusarium oxysporum f. sp. albedinis]